MKLILCSALLILVSAMSSNPVLAQEVAYGISWGAPNGHYFDIEMRFQNPEQGPVSVRMPEWRPGRYIMQNYAKNIIRFAAVDGEGASLNFQKTDKGTWRIDAAPGQEVVVTYQAYSHDDDAGSSYLDDHKAYINPITMLMYLPGHELMPTSLSVKKPADWKTATQLVMDETRNVYVSENYHELVDGPLMISPDLEMSSFEFAGATFEVAILGHADLDMPQLLSDLQKIAEVESNLMGVVPFDRYVFLYQFFDRRAGHAVEHKNSSEYILGPASAPGLQGHILSVSAHELFHAWNVERIRPEAIYQADYSSEQYTTTMWIYEGITSYYASVALVRAGLITEEAFLGRLAGSIKAFETSYGKDITSIAMSSWDSWTKSDGKAPPDTYYSFYTAGDIMGLLLDMEVRGRTRNRQSLDSAMQYLYQEFAARHRGVPEDGLQRAIEAITSGTMQPFFDSYIFGTEPIDYDKYLYYAGYRLEVGVDPALPPVWLGIELVEGKDAVVIKTVHPETPAFKAGLDIDDTLVGLDGHEITTSNLQDLLRNYKPGDTVSVTYIRRHELKKVDVVLESGGNKTYKLVRLPETTLIQNQTRRDWMNLAAG